MSNITPKSLRICYFNHGKSLEFFLSISNSLRASGIVVSESHFVVDKKYYSRHTKQFPDSAVHENALFEWELYQKAKVVSVKNTETSQWETFLKLPSLWPLLVSDRRIFLGRKYKFSQDDKPRYSLHRMEQIVVTFLSEIKSFLMRQAPDLVVIFTPATLGAVAAFYLCKSMNIKVLVMKSTKVSNLVTLTESILEENIHIENKTLSYSNDTAKPTDAAKSFAENYLRVATASKPTYEGVLLRRSRVSVSALVFFFPKLIYAFLQYLRSVLEGKFEDPHFHSPLRVFIEDSILRSLRSIHASRIMKTKSMTMQDLKTECYAFFPLNSEPEISLSVYSRYYMDQVSVIKNIAQSLPFEMKLLVKEHPRSLGWRHSSFYKELLNIPNVFFVDSLVDATSVLKSSKIVILISSFVGIEAILKKKPVITLGNCSYNFFPNSMVRNIKSWDTLPSNIADLINRFSFDESYLLSYIAAVYDSSCSLDLYTKILGKSRRDSGTLSSKDAVSVQISNFSKYLIERYVEI